MPLLEIPFSCFESCPYGNGTSLSNSSKTFLDPLGILKSIGI
jgi:hypothetical protein